MASTPLKGFGHLPLELLEQILDILDPGETPSFRALRQEPSSVITHADIQPLKCLSRTCHSLRRVIVERLFQTAVLSFDVSLNRKVRLHWKSELCAFQDFLVRNKLRLHLRSVVVQFIVQTPMRWKIHLNKGFAGNICSTIMHLHKPETLTVIIPPSLLPYLAPHGCPEPEHDEGWISNAPSHVLTCVRFSESPADFNLHSHLGLWKDRYSSITLNEASWINMFSSYDYYLKNPYSMFSSRQFQHLIQSDWHCWLREFTYIAIFPIAIHVHDMFEILRDLHRLEVLAVKFGPDPNEVSSGLTPIPKCHVSDLWGEFQECYWEALGFAGEMCFSHRLRLFRSLDWRNHAERMQLNVEMYLEEWIFCDDSWRKPTGDNMRDIGAISSFN